jgi:membrane-bound lytic murein transglycosylase D
VRGTQAKLIGAALAALLAACASPPPSPAPQAEPERPAVLPRFRVTVPQLTAASPAAREQLLDASRLPPFEGERREVREPLRGVTTIDRTVQPDDLWQRIRNGFAMTNLDNDLVRDRTAWYVARPDYLQRMFERSRRYLYHIVDEIEKRGLPTELALLPMVESSFNPMAYSRAHASGLWQFIPGTGKRYELKQNWWYDGRRDIVASTGAALEYLKDVYEMHGDWHLALASYNWGEHAVARAIGKNRAAGQPTDYPSLTMPAETRNYVPKLQALKNIIANPQPFGISLDPIPNQPYFATVEKERDIDVRLAAKLAEMPVDEFIALNPGFNRPVIRTDMASRIVLPAEKVEVFHANLLKHDQSLVSWQTYSPKNGEKLEAIAKRFGVPIATLREVNGIGPRTRGTPALLVVPANGAKVDLGRMPIMYAPPIPAAAPRNLVHTVKAGDTLASIAARYRVKLEDLRRWNAIGRLAPGQKLRIQGAAPEVSKSLRGKKKALPKGKPKPAPTKRPLRKAS